MADILIHVHAAMGTRLPSLNEVAIVEGDTITFISTSDDSALHFSPDLLVILSPNHDSVALLQGGQQLSYSFTSVAAGDHQVILQDPSAPAPEGFTPTPDAQQPSVFFRAGGAASAATPDSGQEPVSLKASFEEVSFQVDPKNITSNPIGT